jgi:hypothetical protein
MGGYSVGVNRDSGDRIAKWNKSEYNFQFSRKSKQPSCVESWRRAAKRDDEEGCIDELKVS